MMRHPLRLVLFTLWAGALGAACGDDDAEEDPHGEVLESATCEEISEACHSADSGSGPAHACHELAHEDIEADCVVGRADCLATCVH
jgi:hypothetical protein